MSVQAPGKTRRQSGSAPSTPVSPDTARDLILRGNAPGNLQVTGPLSFANELKLKQLPPGLTVSSLDLSGCRSLEALPPGLRVRRLTLTGDWNPQHLLPGLSCYELDLKGTRVEELPADLRVEYRLDLEGCRSLRKLPAGLKVGSLILRDCDTLEALPEGLDVYFLDVSGCTSLARWPEHASLQVGRLAMRGCSQLRSLPPWLTRIAQLDLRDCAGITRLPDGLTVASWIDVAGTGITSLPPHLDGVRLRWRGVDVDARVAFLPETITSDEVLAEDNAEKRRVMLERMGYEKFFNSAKAQVLHTDTDPGGERRLLKVPMQRDEDLVCLQVSCPSTGRKYVIRVPPKCNTCHEAAAWIAGFDDPSEYKPVMET
jgi:hypothetical protein